jgi:hypothetical protein
MRLFLHTGHLRFILLLIDATAEVGLKPPPSKRSIDTFA